MTTITAIKKRPIQVWKSSTSTTKKLSGLAALSVSSLFMLWQTPVLAAEFCADQYYIDTTMPNQARWDMCWEHRAREGIVLHKIHYTPKGGERRMVLNEAAIAQIHVPYDDNGTRYHDVSDYGLGSRYMSALSPAECPDGNLLRFGSKQVICQQLENRDDAYSTSNDRLQGNALSLFSVSKIGAYNYIPTWRFFDDGAIEPAVGATGALQRYGNISKDDHGWLVSANKVGIAHLHNFFWKLDFDLAGSSRDDYVEELNFTQSGGRTTREMKRYTQETASDINPQTMRRWRIVDGNVTNNKGKPISYEVRLHQSNHRDSGPDTEPFTKHDLYVTRYNRCELFASHNPGNGGCANNLAAFVNSENIAQQDIVIWPSTTFYHMPRAEDAPHMDAHWSSISITPRDWHDKNPLSDADETQGAGGGNTDNNGNSNDNDVTSVIVADNFESNANNWTINPDNSDTAHNGQWEIATAQQTSYNNQVMQRSNASNGNRFLVTGATAGTRLGSHDIDGGTTSIRSIPFNLPAGAGYRIKLDYYFAHLSNTNAADYLRVSAVLSNGSKQVLMEVQGRNATALAQWKALDKDISDLAGATLQLLIEAADGDSGSIVEAGIDNIRIERTGSSTGDTGGNNGGGDTDNGSGNNDTDLSGQALFSEDFLSANNWNINPANNDTASKGQWQAGRPEATYFGNLNMQQGTGVSGSTALVTGKSAGNSVGTHDIDNGRTSIRSPRIDLPTGYDYQLDLSYYFAHLQNTTNDDYLRISIETTNGNKQRILNLSGSPHTQSAAWKNLSYNLSEYRGNSIYLLIEAADGGTGSIIEAGIDNIRVTYQ
uniref:Amine oxidase n=1 Tax=uncultured Thiotrichaceae bacterium TaxID=298394 RepID=A0A6S6UJ82_9GAMM|nr:MAG: Monoamine oxidase [uncultured Thiotrichaceae bacterium]